MTIFDLREPGPHLFAVAPGRPFFQDVVAAILADHGDQPERLADLKMFVPSRRAVRSLKEAFAKLYPGGAVLLPKITAVADLSEDDIVSGRLEQQSGPLPDAPSGMSKRLFLAGAYRQAQVQLGRMEPSWPAALRAAGELSRTADLLTEYGIAHEHLATLQEQPVMQEGAAHWRDVSNLLALVTAAWPTWLREQGLIDPRERHARLLEGAAERLAADDKTPLIVAAGFLGTTPSSQMFIKRVAGLPRGAVVMPAYDTDLSDEAWGKIEAPHPQSSYQVLLADVFEDCPRHKINILTDSSVAEDKARRELLSLALMPAEATASWTHLFRDFQQQGKGEAALAGLQVAVAPTSEDEADWIAIHLRGVLETQGQTGALVTADRTLARRVAAKLSGWGIELDDSGGKPLSGSYRATFLRSVAQLMDTPSDPVALASTIHHQLFGMGLRSAERRTKVQATDLFLRGRAPRDGWDGLIRSLDDDWRPQKLYEQDREQVHSLISALRDVFEQHDPGSSASLADRLSAHITIAAALASTPDVNGSEAIFRFEDGEALEQFLDSLMARPDLMAGIDGNDYAELFDAVLGMAPAFRPPGGQHPRLSVYGILEARLQNQDVLVIGGLQEGVWPGDEVVDPFLSRGMRRLLGLPSPDADIGRVAHDFFDLAASRDVLLTRSERQGSAVAKPSRFMVRLESFLLALDTNKKAWDAAPRLAAWAQERFSTTLPAKRAPRPTPMPPVRLRPTTLSVSAIGRWIRDPYSIYAERVLGLRALRPYDDGFGFDLQGMLLHSWAEDTVQLLMDGDDRTAEQLMAFLLDDLLERYDVPLERQLLNRRFVDKAMSTFPAFHQQTLEHGEPSLLEATGELKRQVMGVEVTIRGRADRIDRGPEGAHIIDYKSGDSGSIDEMKNFSPQLYLLALMMEAGAFQGFPAKTPWQVSFVSLKNPPNVFSTTKDMDKRFARSAALAEELRRFEDVFMGWLELQYHPDTVFLPQLAPQLTTDMGDYDCLSRRLEWSRGDADDD